MNEDMLCGRWGSRNVTFSTYKNKLNDGADYAPAPNQLPDMAKAEDFGSIKGRRFFYAASLKAESEKKKDAEGAIEDK